METTARRLHIPFTYQTFPSNLSLNLKKSKIFYMNRNYF